MTVHYSKTEIFDIFYSFYLHNPNPNGELIYTYNFTLLIAVLLSAQATDKSVNKVTQKLFTIANNAYDMAKIPIEQLETIIKTIGLWRAKAKNIILLSQTLIELYNGEVPQDLNQLIKLPGVGRKTANVVLNIAFGLPTLAVDTHIFRIANRTKLAPGSTTFEVEKKLCNIIPQQYLKNAHLWLILHGRYICKARIALCNKCFINNLCKAECNIYYKANHPFLKLE